MASEQVETARAEAGAVAGTVKQETKNVAQEAQKQATSALHQVQDDVRARADEEAAKFAETLHGTSSQLASMAGAADGNGVVASLVREGANATEKLASRLEDGGVEAIMADARSWARRRPGAFLLGAVAAGFVAGRLVRNLGTDESRNPETSPNGFRTDPANTTAATANERSSADAGRSVS
jgi:hypothetical protein